ncbi:MAG: hypothetical protein KBC84_06780, partial [Proteobacteria bacterium]|nr:hypothetical protein [Pseudomonadota bacterium]
MSNFTTLVQVAGNTLAQLPKVPVVQEGAVPMVVTNKLYQPFADQVADLKSKNPTLPIYVKQLNGFIAKDGTFSFPDVTNGSGKFQLGNLINHLNSLAAIPTTLANENSEIKTNYTQASREAIKARLLFPLSCM